METIDKVNIYEETDNIDEIIMNELNEEITKISNDTVEIEEIMKALSSMVNTQGDNVNLMDETTDNVSDDVSKSIRNLADAYELKTGETKILRDVAIVAGGIVIGGLGFIVGPLIGVASLITGTTIGGGIVYSTRKSS